MLLGMTPAVLLVQVVVVLIVEVAVGLLNGLNFVAAAVAENVAA